jgi:hypothetical protein
MTSTRTLARVVVVPAIILASTSCGDVARAGRSPVYLVMNGLSAARGSAPNTFSSFLLSDVITNVTAPPPCSTTSPCPTVFNDPGQAVFSLAMKDVSLSPTTNNQVTITRYRVDYTRTDGRNTPGVDVPYGFDSASTGTLLPGSTLTLGFELVRHAAKEETPLIQLINNTNIIDVIATVTFYGTDQVGNAVSVSGNIRITFGNFGDTV